MLWKAAKTSFALSVLFLLVYGGCNYITSLRQDVGTWVYGWERYIPFVPLFIVPYMSIDLFFVASPFLCRDDNERRVLARRICMAIVVAGAFFLIMPLRLAWPRPQTDGWLGAIFSQFLQMDKPYNLAPSLHIALRTILADVYARHTRGTTRWLVHIWFCLVGVSTLLVYQHHFIDVVGGFILACLCFYIIRPTRARAASGTNRTVGAYYALGSALMLGVAVALRSWWLWLIWPALATGLVAVAYYGLGPIVYRKENGRLPLASRLVLLPVLVGQRISRWYYARQCRRWDRLTDHVWIGRGLHESEARRAVAEGVTAVIDLTGDFSEARKFLDVQYLNLQVLDLTAPTPEQTTRAMRFIDEHAPRGIVYVHCKIGYSRTATIAGAWLLHAGLADSTDAAMEQLRRARPSIVIRPEARAAIMSFHAKLSGSRQERVALKEKEAIS